MPGVAAVAGWRSAADVARVFGWAQTNSGPKMAVKLPNSADKGSREKDGAMSSSSTERRVLP
jgi:hypothetical protein